MRRLDNFLYIFFIAFPLLAFHEKSQDISIEPYVNPVEFNAPISLNSKTEHGGFVGISIDSKGDAFVLTGKPLMLVRLDSNGKQKSTASLISDDSNKGIRCKSFAVDKNDNIFVMDHFGFKIHEYDKSLKLIRSWSSARKKSSSYFMSLKMDPDGNLWLLQNDFKIIKFNKNLFPIQAIELKPEVGLTYPSVFHSWDFDFDHKGNVYTITAEDYIFKFDMTGKCLKVFGGCGSKPGQLLNPQAIACGLDNCIYVSVPINSRILKFSVNGKFLTQWHLGEKLFAQGMSVDSHDDLWVLVNGNVLKFNKDSLKKNFNYFNEKCRKEEKNQPYSPCFTLDEQGNICEDFWKYSPRPPAFVNSDYKIIKASKSLVPFAKTFGGGLPLRDIVQYNPAKDDSAGNEKLEGSKFTKKEFIHFKKELKILKEYGFDMPEDVLGAGDLEMYQETKWGYLWGFFDTLYFIPLEEPTEAVFIENDSLRIDKVDMECLGPKKYRVVAHYSGSTGRFSDYYNVYDLDLKNRKNSITEVNRGDSGSACLDLDKNGHFELIVVEWAAETFRWPWIFSWDGKEWIDTSSKYPEFYKTKGVSLVSDSGRGYRTDYGVLSPDQQLALKALQTAALKGGPSAFGKFTHPPQKGVPGVAHHIYRRSGTTPVN
jgi:hypothetical protein